MFWGFHYIADCKSGEYLKVQDGKHIENFAIDLVKRIKMVPYGPPQVKHFGKKDPKIAGYTLVQLIETSSITCHFCDNNGDFYLDVFSCCEFDPREVKKIVIEYFNPVQIREMFLTRQA